MKKIKNIIHCEYCNMSIERFGNQSWKEILNKAGWKWCKAHDWTNEIMLCYYCTFKFEKKYNIDHITGLQNYD